MSPMRLNPDQCSISSWCMCAPIILKTVVRRKNHWVSIFDEKCTTCLTACHLHYRPCSALKNALFHFPGGIIDYKTYTTPPTASTCLKSGLPRSYVTRSYFFLTNFYANACLLGTNGEAYNS